MEQNVNRERIARIIRELQARTVSNGCTEAEAIAAAQKLDSLIREYNITMDEASIMGDQYGARKRPYATGVNMNRWPEVVNSCSVAISEFTDTKVTKWYNGEMLYFGTAKDTEMAFYLCDMIQGAMEQAWKLKQAELKRLKRDGGTSMHGRTLRASFMLGMGSRIAERLRRMVAERKAAEGNSCTAIMVVKSNVTVQKYKKYLGDLGVKLRTTTSRRHAGSRDAYNSGRSAGDNVNFNRPVSGATSSANRLS